MAVTDLHRRPHGGPKLSVRAEVPWSYYNEIEPFAAQWLRNLIAKGLIAPGDVDERSIKEVKPDDIRRYTQCHFFAGIGIWSAALRQAGWPDDRPVWTGSCPCQPFSAAGKRGGAADDRHLWPEFYRLIAECRPVAVLGEQVASKDGLAWLDAVQADLEGAGYATGAVDLCAAGVGAPHIRQRLWFVAYSDQRQRGRLADGEGRQRDRSAAGRDEGDGFAESGCGVGELADSLLAGRPEGRPVAGSGSAASSSSFDALGNAAQQQQHGRRGAGTGRRSKYADAGGLGDVSSAGLQGRERDGRVQREAVEPSTREAAERRGPANGFWHDAEWIACTDGKARPVEPGTFPLAHDYPQRVGRLRAYGNAIVQEVAAEFIRAVLAERP